MFYDSWLPFEYWKFIRLENKNCVINYVITQLGITLVDLWLYLWLMAHRILCSIIDIKILFWLMTQLKSLWFVTDEI